MLISYNVHCIAAGIGNPCICVTRVSLSQEIDVKVIGLVYMMLSAKQLKFAQLLRDALIARVNTLSISQLNHVMLFVVEAANTRPHCNDSSSPQDDLRRSKVS